MPGGFRTNVQKLSKGYWPWTEGIRSRFPMHYKKRFALKYMTEPAPVHYRPDPRKYTIDEYGIRYVFKVQTLVTKILWDSCLFCLSFFIHMLTKNIVKLRVSLLYLVDFSDVLNFSFTDLGGYV